MICQSDVCEITQAPRGPKCFTLSLSSIKTIMRHYCDKKVIFLTMFLPVTVKRSQEMTYFDMKKSRDDLPWHIKSQEMTYIKVKRSISFSLFKYDSWCRIRSFSQTNRSDYAVQCKRRSVRPNSHVFSDYSDRKVAELSVVAKGFE